jgi:hypothetical protein
MDDFFLDGALLHEDLDQSAALLLLFARMISVDSTDQVGASPCPRMGLDETTNSPPCLAAEWRCGFPPDELEYASISVWRWWKG